MLQCVESYTLACPTYLLVAGEQAGDKKDISWCHVTRKTNAVLPRQQVSQPCNLIGLENNDVIARDKALWTTAREHGFV